MTETTKTAAERRADLLEEALAADTEWRLTQAAWEEIEARIYMEITDYADGEDRGTQARCRARIEHPEKHTELLAAVQRRENTLARYKSADRWDF